MIAATSFCQTSTESQESLPDPAMVGVVEVVVRGGWYHGLGRCWTATMCGVCRSAQGNAGSEEKANTRRCELQCGFCGRDSEVTLIPNRAAWLPTMHVTITSESCLPLCAQTIEVKSEDESAIEAPQSMHVTACIAACCSLRLAQMGCRQRQIMLVITGRR